MENNEPAKKSLAHISIEESSKKIDRLLSKYSMSLFDIHDDSRIILGIIAQNGPLNEYQIAKKGFNRGLNRDSVRRRTVGRETSSKSLSELNYLIVKRGSKHRTGTIEKQYHLTLKGLMASLTETNFEKNYLVQNFQKYIEYWSKNNSAITEIAIQYMKHHLALIMSWHVANGLPFTLQKDTVEYLGLWNHENPFLDPTYRHTESKLKKMSTEFLETRFWYFVYDYSIAYLLKKLHANEFAQTIEYDSLSGLAESKVFLGHLWLHLNEWLWNIDRLQFEDVKKYDPWKEVVDPSSLIGIDDKLAEQMSEKILKNYGIPNVKFDRLYLLRI